MSQNHFFAHNSFTVALKLCELGKMKESVALIRIPQTLHHRGAHWVMRDLQVHKY